MNICIVNEGYEMGGVEKVAIELANYMAEISHDVTLVDFSGINHFYYDVNDAINKPKAVKKRSLKRKIIRRCQKYKYYINKKPINVLDLYKEQFEDLRRYIRENSHEILIMCQGNLTALIPFLKEEFPSLKIIAWQHNEFEIYIKNYYNIIIDDYLNGLNKADLIVCLTKLDEEKYSQYNNNCMAIYNPLTISNNYKRISSLQNRKIIFVGRLLIEQKGLDYLIELAKYLNEDWEILIAGSGPDEEKIKKMIRTSKLENRIKLVGPLNSDSLERFYSKGSIFVSTSRWEGFGLVITEAMTFGLPIISFRNHGPEEILGNGKYGVLVDKYDIPKFASVINDFCGDYQKREYYQEKSLKRVKDFSKEEVFGTWNKMLSQLLKSI